MMSSETERMRRWRLVLGEGGCEGEIPLNSRDSELDRLMEAIFGGGREKKEGKKSGRERGGGLGASMPNASGWLGDIRNYFPSPVVDFLQQEAIEQFGLHQMLKEKKILETLTPDVHLAALLVQLKDTLPAETRETARQVVRKIVEELKKKLDRSMRQAVSGALHRASRNFRPRHHEIDWNRTLRANLHHYQPELGTIIPEKLIGYGRKRTQLEDIILCVDQSGSMAQSVVYASVFAAVMASLPALKTSMVVFDTAVVDLTELLKDPSEVLFAAQLGGGTDIGQALAYSQTLVRRPQNTTLILISDLYEGGDQKILYARIGEMLASGVKFIALLALSDEGAPSYSREVAQQLANWEIPAFACTPEFFPELMAAALSGKPMLDYLGARNVKLPRPSNFHGSP